MAIGLRTVKTARSTRSPPIAYHGDVQPLNPTAT